MPLQTPDDDRRPADQDPVADRFDDDLLGLDPNDPEARAFAEHLERQQRVHPGFTVEGYISGMGDFATSANRLGGHRKLMASLLTLLILLGVIVAAWDAIIYVVTTFAK